MPEFDAPEPGAIKGRPFGTAAILPIFKNADFPITKQEIIQKYGDREVEYKTGETMKIKDIFDNAPAETFHSPEDIEKIFHQKLSQQ